MMEDNTKGKHEIEEGRRRYKLGLKVGRKQKETTVNSEIIAEKSKEGKEICEINSEKCRKLDDKI